MRGLLILLVSADRTRADAAIRLAMAHAALGARTRLHFDEAAVALLAGPLALDEAIGLGVEVSVCQSGLALSGGRADALPARVEIAGPLTLLADLGDNRLVTL